MCLSRVDGHIPQRAATFGAGGPVTRIVPGPLECDGIRPLARSVRPGGSLTRFRLIAAHAVELDPDPRRPAFRRGHPRAYLPRRIVPHVLRVPALELGHPVTVLVLMITDDRAAQLSLGSRAW